MSLTLTPDEIFAITRKVQPAAQLKQLQRMGIRAYRTDDPEQPITVCRVWLSEKPESEAESRPMLKSDRQRHGQATQAR